MKVVESKRDLEKKKKEEKADGSLKVEAYGKSE